MGERFRNRIIILGILTSFVTYSCSPNTKFTNKGVSGNANDMNVLTINQVRLPVFQAINIDSSSNVTFNCLNTIIDDDTIKKDDIYFKILDNKNGPFEFVLHDTFVENVDYILVLNINGKSVLNKYSDFKFKVEKVFSGSHTTLLSYVKNDQDTISFVNGVFQWQGSLPRSPTNPQ